MELVNYIRGLIGSFVVLCFGVTAISKVYNSSLLTSEDALYQVQLNLVNTTGIAFAVAMAGCGCGGLLLIYWKCV
ncbi:MAG: hypothetical protein AEth_01330 [Candidatus Argoarchaeum ethanivorans]|uniref:Uncharacterized protein n=1 Tax=Candidatus Argoarchaeum ethanivorans TaxID=2608793 RepID=A0A8B3S086_9EURY|nr:MAG: hypothetical protein AEth_01330 [Candidatus Argoarchaeum ethanivorans]